MQVLSTISIDLQRPRAPIIIHAKQGDKLTRGVVVKLYSNGAEWTIPTEVTDFYVAYSKPDGKGGNYNKMPDNTTPACTSANNTITAIFAPQVLTCAGRVRVDINMVNANEDALHTFGFYIQVEAAAESGITSEDYWKNPTLASMQAQIDEFDTKFVQIPDETAYSGDLVSVAAIGSDGKPTKMTYTPRNDFFFCPEVEFAGTAGTEINIDGKEFFPHQPLAVGAIIVGKNGYTAAVTSISDSNTMAKSTGMQIITPGAIGAKDVSYSGSIGEYEPRNVSSAIEALMNYTDDKVGSIPVTKDATADYAASGASTVQAWATMADAGNANSYRVREGRYRVTDLGDVCTVEIVDSTYTSRAVRRVTLTSVDDEANAYWHIYTSVTPGTISYESIGIAGDIGAITLQSKQYQLLPTTTTADNGSFLRVVGGAWTKVQLTDVSEVGA